MQKRAFVYVLLRERNDRRYKKKTFGDDLELQEKVFGSRKVLMQEARREADKKPTRSEGKMNFRLSFWGLQIAFLSFDNRQITSVGPAGTSLEPKSENSRTWAASPRLDSPTAQHCKLRIYLLVWDLLGQFLEMWHNRSPSPTPNPSSSPDPAKLGLQFQLKHGLLPQAHLCPHPHIRFWSFSILVLCTNYFHASFIASFFMQCRILAKLSKSDSSIHSPPLDQWHFDKRRACLGDKFSRWMHKLAAWHSSPLVALVRRSHLVYLSS